MSLSGTELTNQVTDATRRLRGGIYTADGPGPADLPGQQTASFPRGGLSADSPEDEQMRMKMQFAANNAKSPFGEVYATDKDFRWLQKKRETEAAANFDAWESQNFHTNDVVTRRWLQEVDPDFYKVREQEMTDKAKLALQINLILLHGPKTMKDLVLIWGLETGRIKLDRDWNVIGVSTAQRPYNATDEKKRFREQLMRPWRYKSDDARSADARNPTNPFKTANDQQRQIRSPFAGIAVPKANRYPNFLTEALDPYIAK